MPDVFLVAADAGALLALWLATDDDVFDEEVTDA